MPALLFAAALAAVAARLVQPAPPPDQLLTRYAQVSLDPTAQRIASIDTMQAAGAPSSGRPTVVVRDTGGRVVARHDPCGECGYAGLAWSPNGQRLAFIASSGGTATLYVAEGRGAPRRITAVKGLAATPRWSADGASIAFLTTVDPAKETGATQPGARLVGVIGSRDDSQRIAVVGAAGGAYRLITPDGTFVYEYDWLPDGQGFVATAAEGNGDNRWWVASLRRYGLDGSRRVIAAPPIQLNEPRVSPDGRQVAFVGGLMSDFGAVGGDVYVVPLVGGQPVDVTPGARASFTSLAWRGERLFAAAIVGGSTGLTQIDPAARRFTLLATAAETSSAGDGDISIDAAGTHAAYAAESFTAAPRILFGPLGRGQPVTRDNSALVAPARAIDLRWQSEGHEVQGWLLAPAGAPAGPASARQPMVTVVHGGPASAVTPRFLWQDVTATLLNRGYWLFMPNPRGSFGQGEAFTRANVKDFGGGDLRDILAGIDEAERRAPIDDKRLGLYGHSYGGFMTMWTVTQSRRFKAAVAGAGIADWMAYYGQNGIDQWMVPYFGATAYDDPRTYDRLSPIRYVKSATTPTLMYVGERDVETPAVQSLEYWHALRALGVPTELVIYPDEGHAIRRPEHVADRERRMLAWFDRWLR